ncbi:MAG: LysM peptidoglycan-binding domain-containing protein [candidate division NC10 bacterium]|nr:LysM peptidoglycan-binding domain-containing protein [candidate division NC10 bacterium]
MGQKLFKRPLTKVGLAGTSFLFGLAVFLPLHHLDALRSAAAALPSEVPPSQDQKDRARILLEEIAKLEAMAEEKAQLQTDPALPEEGEEEPGLKEEAPALVSPEDEEVLKEEQAARSAIQEPEEVSDVPIVFNEKVRAYLRLFQTSKRGVISRAFGRAEQYLGMMKQIFKEKGLPEDLINLAFIESAFNPWATSKAKAAGIWQFIESTARRYGLKVSYWIDERRDPEKATRAAAEYLRELYDMFKSWPLALAAYNAGEGKVQAAIERQRIGNFWALRLPKETQLFVPAFMAMTIIAKDPERYGFSLPLEKLWEPDRVRVHGPTDLRLIARGAGTSLEVIRALNPELHRGVTPPFTASYAVRLPPGSKDDVLQALARVPKERRALWATYQARKGDTLAGIAKRHQVPLPILAELNGMGSGQRPKTGSTLRLPIPARVAFTKIWEPSVPSFASDEAKPVRLSRRITHHRVRRGDTLWRITRAYDVSLEDLSRWNDLKTDDSLRPGQILLVAAPSQAVEIPSPSKAPTLIESRQVIKYKVKRGDTLWEIASSYGVTVAELRHWNKLTSRSRIRPGQVLRILPGKSL